MHIFLKRSLSVAPPAPMNQGSQLLDERGIYPLHRERYPLHRERYPLHRERLRIMGSNQTQVAAVRTEH